MRAFRDGQLYFVCAGVDEEGTVAATNLLMERWRHLPRGMFIQVFECDKRTYELKKLGGQHTDRTEGWIRD